MQPSGAQSFTLEGWHGATHRLVYVRLALCPSLPVIQAVRSEAEAMVQLPATGGGLLSQMVARLAAGLKVPSPGLMVLAGLQG